MPDPLTTLQEVVSVLPGPPLLLVPEADVEAARGAVVGLPTGYQRPEVRPNHHALGPDWWLVLPLEPPIIPIRKAPHAGHRHPVYRSVKLASQESDSDPTT